MSVEPAGPTGHPPHDLFRDKNLENRDSDRAWPKKNLRAGGILAAYGL